MLFRWPKTPATAPPPPCSGFRSQGRPDQKLRSRPEAFRAAAWPEASLWSEVKSRPGVCSWSVGGSSPHPRRGSARGGRLEKREKFCAFTGPNMTYLGGGRMGPRGPRRHASICKLHGAQSLASDTAILPPRLGWHGFRLS